MFVKIVRYEVCDPAAVTPDNPRGVVSDEEADTYPCAHVSKNVIREGSVAHRDGSPLGIVLELSPTQEGGRILKFHLPTDGDCAFYMNDGGSTIDRVSWPPRR